MPKYIDDEIDQARERVASLREQIASEKQRKVEEQVVASKDIALEGVLAEEERLMTELAALRGEEPTLPDAVQKVATPEGEYIVPLGTEAIVTDAISTEEPVRSRPVSPAPPAPPVVSAPQGDEPKE